MAAQHTAIGEWREQHARLKFNVDFEPLSIAPFYGAVVPIFEELRIARVRFSPGFTFRDNKLVKDGDDAIGLTISQSRNLQVSHRGRDLQLCRGDATLLHVCVTGHVGSRHAFGYIGVMIPHADFEACVAHPDDAVMRHLPRRNEALQLLRGYLHVLERNRFSTLSEGRELVRRHLIDLAALAVTQSEQIGESSLSAVVAARLTAALDHIAEFFQDPELSVGSVARSLNISPRYLQRLMEISGASFIEHVNESRLQKAFALLSEAHDSSRRISDIALEVGFSDLSHFNRLFRSRFGDTPSGVRSSTPRASGTTELPDSL